jgi:hypothetical protein
MEFKMQINKFLTISTLAMSSLISSQSFAGNSEKEQNKQIVDMLFHNATPQEKARIAEQIKKYSYMQTGVGSPDAVTVPKSPQDLAKNIKSFDHSTVEKNIGKMKESMSEMPKLERVSNKPH